jgi:outer membrane protein OmpA-like peptidoglycan-associated protein
VNEFEQTVIEVAGHTDSTGGDQYNQELSQRRADTVVTYLKRAAYARTGSSRSARAKHPVASNDTPDGRQLNRRVESRSCR